MCKHIIKKKYKLAIACPTTSFPTSMTLINAPSSFCTGLYAFSYSLILFSKSAIANHTQTHKKTHTHTDLKHV